jgi:hypothetical protein
MKAQIMKSPKLCTLVLLLVAACGLAAEPSAQHSVAAAAPALAARYELRIGNHTTDWYLIRTATRVETFNAGSHQGEIWERGANGAIEHRRVFVSERKIVEYSAGELRARGAVPQWSKLTSLVTPEGIAGLRQTGEETLQGQRGQVFEGMLDGASTRLWWLPEAQLPARLERSEDARQVRLDLRELQQRPPARWPRLDEASLAGFSLIDAADFGDMEGDPFVHQVMIQDGHAHGAGH